MIHFSLMTKQEKKALPLNVVYIICWISVPSKSTNECVSVFLCHAKVTVSNLLGISAVLGFSRMTCLPLFFFLFLFIPPSCSPTEGYESFSHSYILTLVCFHSVLLWLLLWTVWPFSTGPFFFMSFLSSTFSSSSSSDSSVSSLSLLSSSTFSWKKRRERGWGKGAV